jgi:hypothetical protein
MKSTKKQRSKKRSFDPLVISQKVAKAITYDFRRAAVAHDGAASRFFASEQINSVLKKFDDGDPSKKEALDLKAFSKFWDVNNHMAGYRYSGLNLPIDTLRPSATDNYSERDQILILAKRFVHAILGDISTEEMYQSCKNSGGTSIGVSFSDTSWESKFSFPISGTKAAVDEFCEYLNFDPVLKDSIEALNGAPISCRSFHIVYSSRATTVEKNSTSRRFIAVEPTLNMFFQQGLMRVLYKRLREFGIDLSKAQNLHKELARVGSITGNYATIDWASASDCVSSDLLEWLMPNKWFSWVDKHRTGFVKVRRKLFACEMFATMGNATTFPLETLVFWTLGLALIQRKADARRHHLSIVPDLRICYREDGDLMKVFGDDCIIKSHHAASYMELLKSVGFIVNEDKSFYDEAPGFRESCGGDYLHGIEVRPFYVRTPHSNDISSLEPWLYTIMNLCIKKYIQYFGTLTYVYEKELWRALSAVFRQYNLKVKFVPPYLPDDAGFKAGCDSFRMFRQYDFPHESYHVGHMGTIRFRYQSFRYRDNRKPFEWMDYARHLKFVSGTNYTGDDEYRFYRRIPSDSKMSSDVPFESPIRKDGYYHVVRGTTSCWSLPKL